MKVLSSWVSLVLAALVCGSVAGEEGQRIKYDEIVTLTAAVHVARQPNNDERLAVYFAIDNQYQVTLECGGQALVDIVKDDETTNVLVRSESLRVFPSKAFSYQLVHLVADHLKLPSGYDFVPQEYPSVEVICGVWNSLQYLPLEFCQKSNLEICNPDKISYFYLVKDYWLGSCRC